MYEVRRKQKIGQDIYELKIRAPHIVKYAKPGNFVIIRQDEQGERIPLTIADILDKDITVIFKVQGKTTADLSKLKKGMIIRDVAGPLGNDAHVDEFGTVCLVGGGTGCVTTYVLSKALKELGNKVVNIIAAQSKDNLIWPDKFEEVSDELIICTDDGSSGHECRVTHMLEKLIRSQHFNRVIVVGPPKMMKEAARLTYQRAKTFVHLSPIMMDGIGMCGGCRVSVGGQTKFACVDGPEFNAHEVDFDSLIYRNRRFSDEEKESHEKHHGCTSSVDSRAKVKKSVKKTVKKAVKKAIKSPVKKIGKKTVKKLAKKPIKKVIKKSIKKSVKSTKKRGKR